MNRIDHLGGHALDPRIGQADPIGESPKRQDPVGKRGTPTFQEMFQKEIRQGKALQFSTTPGTGLPQGISSLRHRPWTG